jgi:DNA-binding protein Fis
VKAKGDPSTAAKMMDLPSRTFYTYRKKHGINVREIQKRLIEKALLRNHGNRVKAQKELGWSKSTFALRIKNLKINEKEIERKALTNLLRRSNGVVAFAASVSGISERTLFRKIKEDPLLAFSLKKIREELDEKRSNPKRILSKEEAQKLLGSKEKLESFLQGCNGNVLLAATLSGINHNVIRNRIKRFGIDLQRIKREAKKTSLMVTEKKAQVTRESRQGDEWKTLAGGRGMINWTIHLESFNNKARKLKEEVVNSHPDRVRKKSNQRFIKALKKYKLFLWREFYWRKKHGLPLLGLKPPTKNELKIFGLTVGQLSR